MIEPTLTPTPTPDPTPSPSPSPAPAPAAAPGPDPALAPRFWEGFTDPALKVHPSVTKFGTPEELAHGLVMAEKRLGVPADQLMRMPTDPNDKAAHLEIYRKLGAPAEAAGYGIELPADADPEIKDIVGKLTGYGVEHGLNKTQLQGLVAMTQEAQAVAVKAEQEATAAKTAEVTKTLQTEWGAKFPVYSKEIGALVNKLGGEGVIDELNAAGLGNSLGLNRMLAKVVDMLAEPGTIVPGDADLGVDRPMTPTAAAAARAQLESDPQKGVALRDKLHPQHKAVVDERTRLLAFESAKS